MGTKSIGILGFGNMGRSVFSLLKKRYQSSHGINFYICSLGIRSVSGAKCVNDKNILFEICDIVFLCVKPQEFFEMRFNKKYLPNDPIIISIMAGATISEIEKRTGCKKIVRSMPNLPLQVGRGIIGWNAKKQNFTKQEFTNISTIFSCFGKGFFTAKEDELNAVTAVSGSGPAYVFLFLNALIQSAMNLGFEKRQAEEIVLETVSGSMEYYSRIKEKASLEKLIEKIKSKKGTTEAALNFIGEKKFYKLWDTAIKKARNRARELSKK